MLVFQCFDAFLFLMHRVELKGPGAVLPGGGLPTVPNAPCGVERLNSINCSQLKNKFLMHRVELKEGCGVAMICYEGGS